MSNDYPKGIWDATEYFGHLAATNRLAKGKGFAFCRVSGLDGFEEALVLPQVLRLSHATEGVLRGERRQDVLRDIIIGFVEGF